MISDKKYFLLKEFDLNLLYLKKFSPLATIKIWQLTIKWHSSKWFLYLFYEDDDFGQLSETAANASEEALTAGLRLTLLFHFEVVGNPRLFQGIIDNWLFIFFVCAFRLLFVFVFEASHEKGGKVFLIFAVLLKLSTVHFIKLKGEPSHVQSHRLLHIRKTV